MAIVHEAVLNGRATPVVEFNAYDSVAVAATLLAVVVGGLLAIGAQVLAARIQAGAARDAWNRTQVADQLAALENMYLNLLRAAHQVEYAVASWQANPQLSTSSHSAITAGNRGLEEVGLAVMLRSGLEHPIVGLITRLRNAAEGYAELHLVSRATAATADETQAQAATVSAAADQLATHLHQDLKKAKAEATRR